MSYTNGLDKPTDYFNTKLYTGNGSTGHAITGVGFQPDWLWIKERSSTSSHFIYDAIRGVNVKLSSNTTDGDSTVADSMTSFDSDGFTVGNNGATNENGQTVVAWNWLAGGTASSNTDGSITSNVSASTTSGFSIVTYTTPSSGTVTVGHGLGVKPDVLITKSRDNTYNWDILHKSINDNGVGRMTFTTSAYSTGSSPYASTTPTSSVFSFSADFYGASDNVTYCFSEKKGFSKFGSYTGNGSSSNNSFVYTGFKPAFVMVKRTNGTGNWWLADNKRNDVVGGNDIQKVLFPNLSSAEATDSAGYFDFFSNGFRVLSSSSELGGSGDSYIYMAFAESPFTTSTGIPTTAR